MEERELRRLAQKRKLLWKRVAEIDEFLRGKTQTVYVGKSRLAEAKRQVENYRRLKALLEEVAQINLVLFRGRDSSRKGSDDDPRGGGP